MSVKEINADKDAYLHRLMTKEAHADALESIRKIDQSVKSFEAITMEYRIVRTFGQQSNDIVNWNATSYDGTKKIDNSNVVKLTQTIKYLSEPNGIVGQIQETSVDGLPYTYGMQVLYKDIFPLVIQGIPVDKPVSDIPWHVEKFYKLDAILDRPSENSSYQAKYAFGMSHALTVSGVQGETKCITGTYYSARQISDLFSGDAIDFACTTFKDGMAQIKYVAAYLVDYRITVGKTYLNQKLSDVKTLVGVTIR